MERFKEWFLGVPGKVKFWSIVIFTFIGAMATIVWRKYREGLAIGAAKERAKHERTRLEEQVERKDTGGLHDDILSDARRKP